jgi:hypothetical protein
MESHSEFHWEEYTILVIIAGLQKSKAMKEVVVHHLWAALSSVASNLATTNLKPQYALSSEALKRIFTLAWHSLDHSYTGC